MKCWKWIIIITIAVIAVLLIAILVPISYASLEPNEVGLDYDKINYKIDTSKLWEEGRHFLGVGHTFRKFPKEMKEVQMKGGSILNSRTKDGLEIKLSLSFQYKLKISLDNCVDLYFKWGEENYESAFNRIARTVLREAVAEFAAIEMFTNRTQVEDKMKSKLTDMLSGLQSTLQNFQLLEITLPSKFTTTIENIEKYKQTLTSVTYKLSEAKEYATGRIEKAMQEKETITQEATSYSKQLSENATARVSVDTTNAANDVKYLNLLKNNLAYTVDTSKLL